MSADDVERTCCLQLKLPNAECFRLNVVFGEQMQGCRTTNLIFNTQSSNSSQWPSSREKLLYKSYTNG
jgi:hypothetical protein